MKHTANQTTPTLIEQQDTVLGAMRAVRESGRGARGANAILAWRCVILSNRFEEFWAYRATPGNILMNATTSSLLSNKAPLCDMGQLDLF